MLMDLLELSHTFADAFFSVGLHIADQLTQSFKEVAVIVVRRRGRVGCSGPGINSAEDFLAHIIDPYGTALGNIEAKVSCIGTDDKLIPFTESRACTGRQGETAPELKASVSGDIGMNQVAPLSRL